MTIVTIGFHFNCEKTCSDTNTFNFSILKLLNETKEKKLKWIEGYPVRLVTI